MSLAAIVAFAKANSDAILTVWLIFEQFLAANKKIKANSTAQLIMNAVDSLVKKNAGK